MTKRKKPNIRVGTIVVMTKGFKGKLGKVEYRWPDSAAVVWAKSRFSSDEVGIDRLRRANKAEIKEYHKTKKRSHGLIARRIIKGFERR